MPVSDSTVRYTWTIGTDENHSALYQGENSRRILGSVFTMWLKDQGDISDWDKAPLLGGIVHAYSNLPIPVVAVWLGFKPSAIWEVDVPASSPPWKVTGPSGNMLTIDRGIVSEED